MSDDLFNATGYRLKVTSAFRDIKNEVKEFLEKYSPTPWLTKYDSRYPNYFDDKPEWKRNGKLFINNHQFETIPVDPVLKAGTNRSSSEYGGNFVGNYYIKYWWPHPLYPGQSGKWYYKKQKNSRPGDPTKASPGLSNHGWGISVDLDSSISKNKKAIDWMANNMLNYGWASEGLWSDDPMHITYYIVAFATPLVTDRVKNSQIKSLSIESKTNIVNTVQRNKSNLSLTELKVNNAINNSLQQEADSINFFIPSSKESIASSFGGGAFGRQRTLVTANKTMLPSLKNTNGLSSKIFKVAKPYNGSSDPGDYLTYDEFFEMMIHPMIGNFSFSLAAVFTAIASREGNLGENKIGIGVANGSEHLGFLQLRCKPEDTNSFDSKYGWLGTSMLWSVPYSVTGEPILSKTNKRYAWEAFIKDENIIKEIKNKASSSSSASKNVALSLLNINTPTFGGEYNATDRKNASAYLADWARIPANQVWMMKSRFTLAPNYLQKQSTSINLPYTPQASILMQKEKPWNIRGVGFLFNPWNISGENTWKQGADVNIAFNVLVNWFKNYGIFSENDSRPTTAQAKARARKELEKLSEYMEPSKKTSFNSWLLGIND